jgi:hypothetical protein
MIRDDTPNRADGSAGVSGRSTTHCSDTEESGDGTGTDTDTDTDADADIGAGTAAGATAAPVATPSTAQEESNAFAAWLAFCRHAAVSPFWRSGLLEGGPPAQGKDFPTTQLVAALRWLARAYCSGAFWDQRAARRWHRHLHELEMQYGATVPCFRIALMLDALERNVLWSAVSSTWPARRTAWLTDLLHLVEMDVAQRQHASVRLAPTAFAKASALLKQAAQHQRPRQDSHGDCSAAVTLWARACDRPSSDVVAKCLDAGIADIKSAMVNLERCVSRSAMHIHWHIYREDWISRVFAARDVCAFASLLISIELHMRPEARDPSWLRRRQHVWRSEAASLLARTEEPEPRAAHALLGRVYHLLLEVESSLLPSAFNSAWELLFHSWRIALQRRFRHCMMFETDFCGSHCFE